MFNGVVKFYTGKTRIFVYVPRWVAILILTLFSYDPPEQLIIKFIFISFVWYIILKLFFKQSSGVEQENKASFNYGSVLKVVIIGAAIIFLFGIILLMISSL